MDKLNRIADLQRILKGRRTPIPLRRLMDQLECSESTARRLLSSYRDDFGAPVVFDRVAGGWSLEGRGEDGSNFLPGFWFKPDELHALLSAHDLLSQVQPGLLGSEVAPLTGRIERILENRGIERSQIARRVRLLPIGARAAATDTFAAVSRAVLTRRQLRFNYRARGHACAMEQTSTRRVSPQRLIWYRSNWYLDAWCHGASAFRTFAVERIKGPRVDEESAKEFSDSDLDAYFSNAYGIFSGPTKGTAVLRFSARRARWVADERWHPNQKGQMLLDGGYELRLPYSDPRELLMDILRYGPDVEILGPKELRNTARRLLEETLKHYI